MNKENILFMINFQNVQDVLNNIQQILIYKK